MYYCTKCKSKHSYNSKKGKEHLKYKKKKTYKTPLYRKKKKEAKIFYEEYKLYMGCCICGYSVCPTALVFHHIEEKDNNYKINYIKFYNLEEDYLKEFEKCVLVCSNCHREIHYDLWYNEEDLEEHRITTESIIYFKMKKFMSSYQKHIVATT